MFMHFIIIGFIIITLIVDFVNTFKTNFEIIYTINILFTDFYLN